MSNLKLFLFSLLLTSLVIFNGFRKKRQFYPSIVYLVRSKPSLMVLYIQGFMLAYIFSEVFKKIFFGSLSTMEVERLTETYWNDLAETCLAFTVFKEDFNPKFICCFTVLLLSKMYHLLADERVDYLERSPIISKLFHVRTSSLLIVLCSMDFALILSAYNSFLVDGPSVDMIFCLEYSILLTKIMKIMFKYVTNYLDQNNQNNFEHKTVLLLYADLFIHFVKLSIYMFFILIMFHFYSLPIFAFRHFYHNLKLVRKSLNDLIMYRKALNNLNGIYSDATEAELENAELCIICREVMERNAKKLPCNHIFHTLCLRSWFIRQQTCPICRLNVLDFQPSPHSTSPAALSLPAPAQQAQSYNENSMSSNRETTNVDEKLLEEIERRLKYLQCIIATMDSSLLIMSRYYSNVPSGIETKEIGVQANLDQEKKEEGILEEITI